MANFPRVRAEGEWDDLSTLTGEEMESFDDHQSKTINADDGSSHSPTTQINLGGEGLNVTGPFEAGDAAIAIPFGKVLAVLGNVELGSTAVLRAFADSLVRIDASALLALFGTQEVKASALFHVLNLGVATFDAGSLLNIFGTALVKSAAILRAESGGSIGIASGADLNIFGTGTVKSGAAVGVDSGGSIFAASGGYITINSGGFLDVFGTATVKSGAAVDVFGTATIKSAAALDVFGTATVKAAATLDVYGVANIRSAGELDVLSGGLVDVKSGGELKARSGATVTLLSGSTVARSGAEVLSGDDAYTSVRWAMFDGAPYPDGDDDITFSPHKYEVVDVPTLTANREWRLHAPPASDAQHRCRVFKSDSAQSLTLKDDDSGTTLVVIPAGTQFLWADFIWTERFAKWRFVGSNI